MLLGIADAPITALEILLGLERTQMALLSCATKVTKRSFPALANCSKSRDWQRSSRLTSVTTLFDLYLGYGVGMVYWTAETSLSRLTTKIYDTIQATILGPYWS
jgi:hypothetical protein